jgi:hypothetical protein
MSEETCEHQWLSEETLKGSDEFDDESPLLHFNREDAAFLSLQIRGKEYNFDICLECAKLRRLRTT